MAMKNQNLLLNALKDAGQYPDGIPLYRVGKNPGLFASKAGLAQEAAQAALQAGYLESIKHEGKAEAVRLTPRGELYLREHLDPKTTVEELLVQLRTSQGTMPRWLSEIDTQLSAFRLRMQSHLEQQGQALTRLITRAESALRRLEAGGTVGSPSLEPWQVEVLQVLGRQRSKAPLPALFAGVQGGGFTELTIPEFHSGLLLLRDRGNITLAPQDPDEEALIEAEYALVDDGCIYIAAALAE
jgi:hypothetical protein